MRKLKLFTLLTALCCSMMLWADDEGPWTRITYKAGQTGLTSTMSSSFNGLNGNHWGNISAWNENFGIGYIISGASSAGSTKVGVFSIYERQESVPSYTRKVLTWTFQVGSLSKRHHSNTALYCNSGPSNDIKDINVDFTYNYQNKAGSGYLAGQFTNQTSDNQGHFTNSITRDFGFDNRNGTSQATKYWSLLLTHVVGSGGAVSDSFEWAGFQSISESWATYYYKYVSFNANGGSGSMSQQTVENSANLKANAFSRTGYTFDGWATSSTGGKAYNNQATITATSSSKGPVTLYARWAGNKYTVTLNQQSGSGGSSSVQATYGSAMPSMTRPTRAGYTFGGYYTGTGGSGTQYYNANGESVRSWDQTSNTTLYAKWTVNTYKVKFNGNGSTSGSMSDQNFTYGTAQNLTANAFSKTGYTFAGWATSADGAKAYDNQQSVNNLTSTNGGTVNLYAVWTVNQYTIKFNNYDGTQLQSSQVNYGATPAYTGATPTKPSTAAYSYTFNGWSPAIATVTDDATYTAQFTEQINQATVDAAIALINAIGSPITAASQTAIDAARNAYDNLTDDQKALVGNLSTLTDAEAALAVVNQIAAIGEVTLSSGSTIADVRAAYNALTGDQQALVGNYSTLTDAETAYNTTVEATWAYAAEDNVLKAYGVGDYTADSPLTLTLTAPSNLQFDGAYKSATLSGSDAWTAAGLPLPTIYYDGITASPSLLGSHTATITVDDKTATLDFEITADVAYKSFFDFTRGILEGTNYDVVSGTGSTVVGLNNGSAGVWWDSTNKYAVFDGQAYLQINNPLGNVDATTGFTIAIDVYISSDNNNSGSYYRTTGVTSNKSGYQRLFDLSDGTTSNFYCLNAGSAKHMGCARKYNGGSSLWLENSSGKTYYNQWLTYTLVVFPGGYTTIYVDGTPIATESNNPTATNVVNNLSTYKRCYMGTSIWEALGNNNGDAFFIGNIRGYQTAEGALLPYYDGSSYQYLLTYKTNGGNAINAAFATALPSSLPTPTRTGFTFSGWYTNEALTTPAVAGAAMTQNTFLYAKWVEDITEVTLTDGQGVTALDTYKGQEILVNYTRSFTEGKTSTVCLPFAYTKKEGDGSFYAFTNIEKEGSEYVATMTEPAATTLEANTPYLYLPNATGDVDFGGAYTIPASLTAGSTTSNGWTFKGTFTTIEWTTAPTGTYGFSAQDANAGITLGQFVKVGSYVRIKPMRCYLENESFAGARGTNRAAEQLPETIKVRLISANGEVNAIDTISTKTGEGTIDNGAWYSLDGRRIEGKPSTKGIYVNNGKKVVIK